MYISMVHIYRSDKDGFYDEEYDFLKEIVVLEMVVAEKLHELSALDEVMEELPVGAYITVEVFIMKYVHFVDETDEDSLFALLSTIAEEMEDMIDDESLILLENYSSTVQIQSLPERI